MSDARILALPLPDADVRERIATDLDTNLLVEAGAGSGKTTALVSRMVALVSTGRGRVEELAAVTFTRKAAGELRERFQTEIERALRKARAAAGREDPADGGDGDGGDGDGEDGAAVGGGDAAVDGGHAAVGGPDAAAELLARALDDVNRAFVGTIHAFCARLLRERPLEVGLDPAFEELPVEERILLRRRFWEAYLERLTRDSDPVLEELRAAGLRPARLFGLFGHLVENPDVEFPAAETLPPSPAELEPARAEMDAILEEARAIMPRREPTPSWDSLQRKLRTLRFTRDVTGGWREPADFLDALAVLSKPGPRAQDITQKRWNDKARAKALRERVKRFAVGDAPANALLDRWRAHRYALSIRLAHRGAEEFAAHRVRVGRLDFQDLLVLAARLLRTNPSVRRALGERYRRLLVDEFQDTDPIQAEIVMLLASEPSGDAETDADWSRCAPRPGALFVVGDPKQSIYRFRRADIQLYGFVKQRFEAFGDIVELTTNFRSRPGIGDLVNEVFDHERFFPREATEEQAAFEPLNTRPPSGSAPAEGVFVYDIAPAADNRAAVAKDDAARLATWIRGRIAAGERKAGDFLILTRLRRGLDVYARALEARGVPVQVTGAGVGVEDEIRELRVVLECMIDPTNPVKVVAALVGLFFGLDYDRLVDHRLEGGSFDAMRPLGRGHPDVVEAMSTLHAWWRSAKREPADVFVSRLVAELGLLPFAAAGELGGVRAGALVYALDSIRAAALAGDASLPGAVAALDAALDLTEAEAPLEPERPDVVRLMNLHQAKGLEATVVALADPARMSERSPDIHTTRTAEGSPRGYLRVTEAVRGFGQDRVLAVPQGWDEKEAVERRFEAAEQVRLLYVAVTRAREELLVSRWPGRTEASAWAPLHAWLEQRATVLDLVARPPEPREHAAITPEEAEREVRRAAAALAARSAPTYLHESVTELTKAAGPIAGGGPATASEASPASAGLPGTEGSLVSDRSAGAKGPPAPDGSPALGTSAPAGVRPPGAAGAPDTSVAPHGFRGFSWGSAVHDALALAAAEPGDTGGPAYSEASLRARLRDLLVEHERPIDEHGGPLELDELVELVRTVRASDLWARARASERVLAEVPFAAPGVADTVDGTGQVAGVGAGSDAGTEDAVAEGAAAEDDTGVVSVVADTPPVAASGVARAGSGRGGDERPRRRQLDLFGSEDRTDGATTRPAATFGRGGIGPVGPPDAPGAGTSRPLRILEGVIDLAFREPDGWVIADYKTDVGTDPGFPERARAYRRQVDLYAEAWARLTGEPVKERVLFFTTQGRTERW